ncbi:inner membrane protein [Klebsiella pneumoniae]|nr:inner membrane protein [Klebsiella pneumoniae]
MSLENASDEVKLAVDLIMLLESHQIPAQTVLSALEIVRRDYANKLKNAESGSQKPREVGCCLRQCAGSLVLCA